jgi:hypothetical protein
MIYCECGCGAQYPASQCMKWGKSQEILYIPHAIDVWGLFWAPQFLAKVFKKANIKGIHLPGGRLACFLEKYPEYALKLHYSPRTSPYGVYYISWQHLLLPPIGSTMVTTPSLIRQN